MTAKITSNATNNNNNVDLERTTHNKKKNKQHFLGYLKTSLSTSTNDENEKAAAAITL